MSFPAFADHTIVQIATGNDHFLALTSEGSVFACGRGEQNQLGRRIISRVRRRFSIADSTRTDPH